MNPTKIIDASKPRPCELCGKVADLRPYGPNSEWICFDCGMKDEETTKRRFYEMLDGGDIYWIEVQEIPEN